MTAVLCIYCISGRHGETILHRRIDHKIDQSIDNLGHFNELTPTKLLSGLLKLPH